MLLSTLAMQHQQCKNVLNYAAANPKLLNETLPNVGPLVICGLPRTGSTLLYNLLACDPNCRAPLTTDMLGECIPPIPRANAIEHQRRAFIIDSNQQTIEQQIGRPRTVFESHPRFETEEDFRILDQAGIVLPLMFVSPVEHTELHDWFYSETNKDFAYDYHKTFLRILNSVDTPRSHWLLKSPEHSLYLDTFLRYYPNTKLVFTHRRLDDVIPSYCRLVWAYDNIYFDEADPDSQVLLSAQARRHIDKMIEHIIKFRIHRSQSNDAPQNEIIDIAYDDLVQQPIQTVRKIYGHFNLRWSHQFKINMCSWLRNNPQGKQGRHTYRRMELDLTTDADSANHHAVYTNLFL
ncbi:unnamed protein product [Rotaria sp. Silwood2]|nr:unnamed protein product [Rotaria sp. Silwood2]CAF3174062.1 unnamed protein product [Rotaria sp. Silwood2]CAF4389629.1 unnamed protein product [Rotaria sp. Silwood2]CAF4426082.1 unnamed protein product [Rotaria sp. Silwood2]